MSAADRGETSAFHGGGLDWTIDARAGVDLESVRAALGSFREIAADPRALVLKSNRMRTVLRFDADGPERRAAGAPPAGLILKQYRHADLPDRIRYRFTASRAAREWAALRRLRALGFDAPRPLAYGERRQGGVPVEGGLLLEEVPRAVSLLDELRSALPGGPAGPVTPRAALLLERAGGLVRALHDRGVDQPDLHPSNLLLSGAGDPEARLYIIDLHSARFRRRLAGRRRRAGLARLVHSLKGVSPPEGLRRLVASYLGSGAAPAAVDALARRLLLAAERVERRRLRSRARRCLLPSTSFEVGPVPSGRLHRRREVPPERLPVLLAEGAGKALKIGPRVDVRAVEAGGSAYLVKTRRLSLHEALLSIALAHRLRRAFHAGYALEVLGVSTPRVLCLLERRRWGFVRSAALVTELVPGGVSLDAHLARELLPPASPSREALSRKRALAVHLGALIRSVHEAGAAPRDFAPQNIIVDPRALDGLREAPPGSAAPLLLADLDRVRLFSRPRRRERLRNLVQAGNLPEGHVTWADRMRALRAYGSSDPAFLSRKTVLELREGLLREAERSLHRLLRHETGR